MKFAGQKIICPKRKQAGPQKALCGTGLFLIYKTKCGEKWLTNKRKILVATKEDLG